MKTPGRALIAPPPAGRLWGRIRLVTVALSCHRRVTRRRKLSWAQAGLVDAAGLRVRFNTSEGLEVESSLADADVRCVAEGLPVRIPPSYAGQLHYPGLFWSTTNGAHVVYESRLELAWLWLADFDPNVERLAAQPFALVGDDDGHPRTRYPDFLWLDSDGQAEVVDVKPEWMLEEPEVRASLGWTGRAVRERGWSYRVWTGAPEVVLRNVRLIGSARRPGLVPEAVVRAAVEACPDEGIEFALLERRLVASGVTGGARTAIFAGLWLGWLSCTLNEPIDKQTRVVTTT